jgi:hypothetical protein
MRYDFHSWFPNSTKARRRLSKVYRQVQIQNMLKFAISKNL